MAITNNNKDREIYKSNDNLVRFLSQNSKNATLRVERDNKIVSYGRKPYLNKLIEIFRSDKTPTSSYWLEVGE